MKNITTNDSEVLSFYPEIGNELISLAMSPDDKKLASIVGRDRNKNFFHLFLNRNEVDAVITALQQLRKEMQG